MLNKGWGRLSSVILHNIAPQSTTKIIQSRVPIRKLCHLHLDSITQLDIDSPDPKTPSYSISDDTQLGTHCTWGDPVLAQYPSRRPQILPPVKSRAALYQNLIHLTRRIPPVTLPQLMDYHDLHRDKQSTRSFNLLISMAIRTASFGSVQWLLQNMEAANISRNLETHKLVIRWQIRIGAWDSAWLSLTEPAVSNLSSINDAHDSPKWPDFLWLEFFASLKRRSLRRKGVVLEEPGDPLVIYSQRFLQLMESRPSFSLTRAKPRIVHSIAYVLLQVQQQRHAIQLVQTYFSHLPAQLTPEFSLHCLDIIHILIVFGSRKRGLKKFHEHRKILLSLLALHPSFKPTSTTLFLLLGSLRGAMRSGALASNCLAYFKGKWGKDMEDRRVRLRVASLALKQGRLDISGEMMSQDAQGAEDAEQRKPLSSSVVDPAEELPTTRRPRFKSIFRGTGKLQALRIRLEKRTRKARRKRTFQDAIKSSS